MGSARTDQNFTSVNERATLDGVVYFFSFEFTKLLALFKDHLQYFFFFVVNMYHDTADTTFFLKVGENSLKRNLTYLKDFLECESGHGK